MEDIKTVLELLKGLTDAVEKIEKRVERLEIIQNEFNNRQWQEFRQLEAWHMGRNK